MAARQLCIAKFCCSLALYSHFSGNFAARWLCIMRESLLSLWSLYAHRRIGAYCYCDSFSIEMILVLNENDSRSQ
jgi:hypothetical protein